MAASRQIRDSAEIINAEFNLELNNALSELNHGKQRDCSCEETAAYLLKSFGLRINNPFEIRLKTRTDIDRYPGLSTANKTYFKNSIYYRGGWNPLKRLADRKMTREIDPILNFDGIYMGFDKLTHFTGSGYLYYKAYRKSLSGGYSDSEAKKAAVDIGIKWEKSILGVKANGVFSFADLEANFQGMLLAIDLCNPDHKYLEMEARGNWILKREVDLRDYINPFWNEIYNPCGFKDSRGTAVKKNMMEYCTDKSIDSLLTRYDCHADSSFSAKYLKNQVDQSRIPDPTSFHIKNICP
ncbi:MAG: hypothetical protein H8D46_01425 [FCB group bacterium]|nr:hypothetical protein [FCB group bacterium]